MADFRGQHAGADPAPRSVEDRLRESEERHRSLVELAPDGITVRREDKIVFANEAAARLFGAASPNELVGVSTIDLTHPECRPALLNRIATLRATGTVVISPEERLLRLDGTPFHADIASVSTTYEGLPAVQSIIRDITARKTTEADLRREALVFAMIGDAVIVMDPDRVIIDWNPAAERIFGYTRAEMLGQPPIRLYPPSHLALQDAVVAALREHGRWGGELPFIRKDGSEGFGDVLIVVQRDAAGRLVSTIGVTRDITERKRSEEALRKSEERLHLSQRLEAVGQLAGGVAHDFNNLLTAITSYTHLLLDDTAPNDRRREDLLEIKKAADRATSLTRQLLAFSRKQVLQPRVLDVNVVVADLEKMLRRLIGEHIALVTDGRPALSRVHADPGQLEQVIVNLAVNARDAMPSGGTLRIATSNVELTAEHWRDHPDVEAKPGRYVLIAVSDTGTGMDPATQARIFEPFFTTKGPGKGTGLGLATVYGIVKQSGGYIWVSSKLGAGATFRIYLPAVQQPLERGEDGVVAADACNGSGTILLVEDEPGVRALARRVLEQAGYVVLAAADGLEAEQLAAGHSGVLDLVITDVVMPNLGGTALVERLRAARPGLNVLFISGYPEGEIGRRALVGEGTSYLEKPFSPQVLRDRVRLALAAARGNDRRSTVSHS
jgi:PAS domain S-box-containing protein